MPTKDTLRQEAIKHRNQIDPGADDPDAIIDLFFDRIAPERDKIISLYWPKGREFDPRGLLERLLREGFTCALPVIQKDERALKFARWDETIPLIKGPFGIMQPQAEEADSWVQPDILCIPMLAFDRKGHRLGYGCGHYDATITALREQKEILTIGLAYAQQAVIFNLPAEDHDQKLDWIITPQKAHCFVE